MFRRHAEGQSYRSVALASAAMIGLLLACPPIGAAGGRPLGPPRFEVAIDPASGPAGTTISYSGYCERGDSVLIRGYRDHPPPGGALDFAVEDHVARDGRSSGMLTVPSEAPPGAYGVSTLCYSTDVAYGGAGQSFTVTDEPPITTTTSVPISTTTTLGPPTTVSPTPVPSSAPPDGRPAPEPSRQRPVPAAPRAASARYTG